MIRPLAKLFPLPVAQALATAIAASVLIGCANLPGTMPQAPSRALADVAAAPLARMAQVPETWAVSPRSGYRLLADATDAWQTRLAMARHARYSLDVQYYLIADDSAGLQFLRSLLDAAERGVRVRLLVDDLYAGDLQATFAALEQHANIEVRLFNPLPARSGTVAQRVAFSLHQFQRINRRMHNKLFVADNSLAVTGGRNIGDEYFMRGATANFVDVDVLVSGPVVRQLSANFDAFWNDPLAYPIASLVSPAQAGPQPLQRLHAAQLQTDPLPLDGVAAQIERGRLDLNVADMQVLADQPDKAAAVEELDRPGEAMEQALRLLTSAQREVLIASPYFIPGPLGLDLMRQARARGVHIGVITNSHGATDEPLAYGGYRRYRLEMLRLGVDVSELQPDVLQQRGQRVRPSSLARLHAKLAVIDRRWVLIGSMNMDRRSSRINTELSLAIDSAELSAEAATLVEQTWQPENYRLRLAANGQRVEWLEPVGGRIQVHASEPDLDWMGRLRLVLMAAIIDEDLL